MYRASGTNLCAPPVQVILQTYESVESLLLNFDIDSWSFAYGVGGSSVYATERGLRALVEADCGPNGKAEVKKRPLEDVRERHV